MRLCPRLTFFIIFKELAELRTTEQIPNNSKGKILYQYTYCHLDYSDMIHTTVFQTNLVIILLLCNVT
jgi:hypothetical protein